MDIDIGTKRSDGYIDTPFEHFLKHGTDIALAPYLGK